MHIEFLEQCLVHVDDDNGNNGYGGDSGGGGGSNSEDGYNKKVKTSLW